MRTILACFALFRVHAAQNAPSIRPGKRQDGRQAWPTGMPGSCLVEQKPNFAGGHGVLVPPRVDLERVQKSLVALLYADHAPPDAQDIAQKDHAREAIAEGLDVAVLEVR